MDIPSLPTVRITKVASIVGSRSCEMTTNIITMHIVVLLHVREQMRSGGLLRLLRHVPRVL